MSDHSQSRAQVPIPRTSDPASLVLYERRGAAIWLTMNRPDVRNALARELLQALHENLARAAADTGARAIVLAGAGPVFCAGADINQYRAPAGRERVLRDGALLYDLLDAIAQCDKPVIARVQRAAFGGAVGLVAAADLAVSSDDARFSLSEAKLGIVPAVIGATVVRAIGPRHARRLMLLAEPIPATEAEHIGLVHRVVPTSELDGVIDTWVGQIQSNAPGALRDTKALVRDIVAGKFDPAALRERAVTLAADRRADPEGQEGLSAFLEKRRPAWNPEG
jgi:methylglutaconyl-CoA hydratase